MTDIPCCAIQSVGIEALGLGLLGRFIVDAGYHLFCVIQPLCRCRLRPPLDRSGSAANHFVFQIRAWKGAGDQPTYQQAHAGNQQRIALDGLEQPGSDPIGKIGGLLPDRVGRLSAGLLRVADSVLTTVGRICGSVLYRPDRRFGEPACFLTNLRRSSATEALTDPAAACN
jgi:hypothetical protein